MQLLQMSNHSVLWSLTVNNWDVKTVLSPRVICVCDCGEWRPVCSLPSGDPCTVSSQLELEEALRLYELNKDSELIIHGEPRWSPHGQRWWCHGNNSQSLVTGLLMSWTCRDAVRHQMIYAVTFCFPKCPLTSSLSFTELSLEQDHKWEAVPTL